MNRSLGRGSDSPRWPIRSSSDPSRDQMRLDWRLDKPVTMRANFVMVGALHRKREIAFLSL